MRTAQCRFAAGQFFVCFLKAFLELLSLCDVPKDALNANNTSRSVVDRRLNDIDEELFAQRRFIFFNCLKNLAGADHVSVIALILCGEFGGVKIKVCLPNNFLQWFTQHGAETLIGESEALLQILAENILGKMLDQ